jgi:hypothetical protein
MESSLHILRLEDDPNEVALIQSTLEAGQRAENILLHKNRWGEDPIALAQFPSLYFRP